MTQRIVCADLAADRESIIRILLNNLTDKAREKFAWFYERNPCGPARCWLAKADGQEPVGSTAIFPRMLYVLGTPRLAGIAGDFSVNGSHRMLGPALGLQKAAVSGLGDNGLLLIYGDPNVSSEPVLRKIGYREVGSFTWMTKPLETRRFLKERYPCLPFLTRFSRQLDLLLRLKSKETYYRPSKVYRIEEPCRFDRRFDRLWERARTQYGIAGDRSSAYLNWRFIECPYKKSHVFALTSADAAEVLGYVIAVPDNGKAHIVDLLFLNSGNVLDVLLSGFLRSCRGKRLESVSLVYFGSDLLPRKLESYGFIRRPAKSKLLVYAEPFSLRQAPILDKDQWYVLAGDSDF